jgi:hypothetical protein
MSILIIILFGWCGKGQAVLIFTHGIFIFLVEFVNRFAYFCLWLWDR